MTGGMNLLPGRGIETIKIPPGGTDVALTPYHVDRSKLFVRERFGTSLQTEMPTEIDAEEVASCIENDPFPRTRGGKPTRIRKGTRDW